jgi:hypothetical protein
MIEVEAPDGTVIEFPAGTSDDTIKRVMRQNYPVQDQQPADDNTLRRGAFGSASDSLASGMMFGFDDEIGAGMVAPIKALVEGTSIGDAYRTARDANRAQKARNREENPVASTVGEVAGGLALGGNLAKGGLTLAGRNVPVIGRTGAAGAEGAAYGGLYGAGNADDGDRLAGAATGAAVGGLTGGILERGGRAVSGALARRGQGAAPTIDDVAGQGKALYDQATQAGVTVKPQAMTRANQNIAMRLKSFGFDDQLQPRTAAALRRFSAAADGETTLTLTELDNLRKIAGTASREATEASDRKAAGMIVEQIDNLIDDASNFSAGSSDALGAMQSARQVWRRKLRMEVLGDINERAMNQATGYENGLVIQLRALANNKKRMRLFTAEEQQLIKDAVRRGGVRSALRAFGMLSPTSTFGGLVSGGTIAGSGIAPGVALAAAGYGSRRAAEAMTRGQFNRLQDSVARGVVTNPALLPNKARPFIGGATAGTTGLLQP